MTDQLKRLAEVLAKRTPERLHQRRLLGISIPTYDREAICAAVNTIDALVKVAMLAQSYLPDDDDVMVPIGGGNPYYHCRSCGVTNVELNMGKNPKTHANWCVVSSPTHKALTDLDACIAAALGDGND